MLTKLAAKSLANARVQDDLFLVEMKNRTKRNQAAAQAVADQAMCDEAASRMCRSVKVFAMTLRDSHRVKSHAFPILSNFQLVASNQLHSILPAKSVCR